MRIFALLAASLLCAASGTAQLVQTVHIVAATNPCDPTATHRIDCTDVGLKSATLDLADFEGQEMTTIVGTATTTSSGCTSIEVSSASAPPFRTVLVGSPAYVPGGQVIVTTTAPFFAQVFLVFGPESAFTPIPGIGGALMIDPTTLFVDPNPIQSLGVALRSYALPTGPAIIGCTLMCQAVVLQQALGTATLLNPTCFTVVAP